jgi:tight adherence protein B
VIVVTAIAAIAAALSVWILVAPPHHDRLRRITSGEPRDAFVRLVAAIQRSQFGPWAGRRREHAQHRQVQALTSLVAELRAGQPPERALIYAAGTPCAWPAAARAAVNGGDVATALRADAAGQGPLMSLAVCWQASVQHGAALSDAVARIATGARAAQAARASRAAELAGPRATARVLALLPVIGVALGMVMGAQPLQWLTGSRPGWVCMVGGIGLAMTGTWWTSRIVARVEALL